MIHTLRRLMVPALLCALALGGGIAWWSQRDRGASAAPLVYVGLGASDAVGVGADRPSSEGWVPLVHAALPSETQLLNLGINGATLDDVLRLQLPVALDARPRWVTLWPGVNDLRASVPLRTFTDNLDLILAQLRPAGQTELPQVVVLSIPDLRRVPAFRSADPATLDARVQQWNAAIAEVARRHGADLVDLYKPGTGTGMMFELAEHPEYVSSDGFHPSSAGYRRLAELALTAIDERSGVSASGR